jgi:hypothetical protein
MFFSIRRKLNSFANNPILKLGFENEEVKRDWNSIIKKINKNAEGKSKALYLKKDGTLVVGVVSHTWLQEMVFYEEEVKRLINKKNKSIKKVKFTLTPP